MTRHEKFVKVCEENGVEDVQDLFTQIKSDFGHGNKSEVEDFGEFCDTEDLALMDEEDIQEWLEDNGYINN